nr:hypothetical protein [Tanacetum cinerariifolium]
TLEESSKTKPLKKLTYITKTGKRHQMTKEDIKIQRGIVELAKAEVVKSEKKNGKKFLTRNLSQDVVEKAYKDKMKYDKNKKDERGIVIRNKATLVVQGHTQEEEIDYDEVFVHVARIEAIRLFLAYASFKDFVVYQMDVKSAFLYGKIEEEMSYMGELTFFLGLQVKQKNDGIFISQDKYVGEILKKFKFTEVKNASTPMETKRPLLKDEDREEVDVHMYRSMIGSLMYLTSLRPDIMFAVYTCARYQVNPKVSHLHDVKRIFRVDGKEIIITESSVRRDLRLADEDGVDCFLNSTIFENLELMGKPKIKNTQVPQRSGSIKHVVDEAVYKELGDRLATPNEASSPGTTSGGGRSDEDRMKLIELMELCTNLQSRVLELEKTKTTQTLKIDSLKRMVKKPEKKQWSRTHKIKRLYKVGLTERVHSSKDEQCLGKDASKHGRKSNDIDADEDITLVNDQDDAKMFDVNDLHGEEVFFDKEVADKKVNVAGEVNAASISTIVSADATNTTDDITLAKTLVEIKVSKPKAKKIVLQEPSESTTKTKIISLKQSQDKGKAIMIKEPVKPKKKDQIRLAKEASLKLQAELQAEFDEEQRLAREKVQKELEANIALIET